MKGILSFFAAKSQEISSFCANLIETASSCEESPSFRPDESLAKSMELPMSRVRVAVRVTLS